MANPNMYKGMPSLNPKGRPPGVFHTLSDTRSRLLTEYTRQQLVDIASDDEALDQFTAFQAQVIIGLAESLARTPADKLDPSKERERMYDREIGKPSQPVEVDVNVKVHLAKRLDEAFQIIDHE